MNLHDEMLKMKNAVRSKTGGTNNITGRYLRSHVDNIPNPLNESSVSEALEAMPDGYKFHSIYEDDFYVAVIYATDRDYSTGQADIYLSYKVKSTSTGFIKVFVGRSRVELTQIHGFRNQDGCINLLTGYGVWYQPAQYVFSGWQYKPYTEIITGPYLPAGLREGQIVLSSLYRLNGYGTDNNTLIAGIQMYYNYSPVWGWMYFAVKFSNSGQANYPRIYIDADPQDLYHKRLYNTGAYGEYFQWANQPIGWFNAINAYTGDTELVLCFATGSSFCLLMMHNGYSYEGSSRKTQQGGNTRWSASVTRSNKLYELQNISSSYVFVPTTYDSGSKVLKIAYSTKVIEYSGKHYGSYDVSVSGDYYNPGVYNYKMEILKQDRTGHDRGGTFIIAFVPNTDTGIIKVQQLSITESGSVTTSDLGYFTAKYRTSGQYRSYESIALLSNDKVLHCVGSRMSAMGSLYGSITNDPYNPSFPVVLCNNFGPYLIKYTKLKPLFRAMANAIRNKRGISNNIAAKDFYDQIGRIS